MNMMSTQTFQDPSRMTFNDSQFSPNSNFGSMNKKVEYGSIFSPHDTMRSQYDTMQFDERVSF